MGTIQKSKETLERSEVLASLAKESLSKDSSKLQESKEDLLVTREDSGFCSIISF